MYDALDNLVLPFVNTLNSVSTLNLLKFVCVLEREGVFRGKNSVFVGHHSVHCI